ncbi:MAG TPA: DEAD/DEAH box helicase family protein [Ignavibacteriaceae bacterium]|nr:DEAD/DEAH box helicase family protein [Ignavibacteriaceae bacterium]
MAKRKRASTINEQKVVIPLEQAIPEIEGRKAWEIPVSHLEKDGKGGYKVVNTRRPSKTLLANNIRKEVDAWREAGYKTPQGISQTSLTLLNHWFGQDHIVDGEVFHFRFTQREAIETTIYLYEVKGVRDNALLAEKYMDAQAYSKDLFTKKREVFETAKSKRILTRVVPETGLLSNQDLPPEGLTRYCAKAATGSGKTNVMAFLAVWSYFHKKFEDNSDLSKTILVIAPNVIVYERLKTDFENGNIFYHFPFIPDEWKYDWHMTFIMREDQVKTSTDGTFYLTNIHQIYESRAETEEDLGPIGNLLGQKPKKDSQASWLESLYDRIMKHEELLVINDEAHHVHDEDLAWYKSIISFHNSLIERGKNGLSLLFDLTATPKDQNGTFFPWIITDYPLAQAIEDKIVKTPLIVHQSDKTSPDNKQITNAYNAYNEWIQIALKRYQEHYDCYYKNLGQKPVLFIMAEDTKQANQIAEGIQGLAGFNKTDQVLVIHTKNNGELTTNHKELEALREQARMIDDPKSPVKAVVSVLMLREGWDVKNVSIILGLRPFTSKANILPEQSIGRGLRLMKDLGPDYTQILEIIGTDKFEEFVKQLETEGVGVGVTVRPPSMGVFVTPIKTRDKFNFEIPVLSSSFTRKMEGISTFDSAKLQAIGNIDDKGNYRELQVTLTTANTDKKVGTKQVIMEDDEFVSIQELLSSLTNKIIKEGKFSAKFNELLKITKKYVKYNAFGKEVNLDSLAVRRTLAKPAVSNKIMLLICQALGEHIKVKTEVKVTNYPINLMELDGFYWKRDHVQLKKTVFNYTPVYNELEKGFAKFLEQAEDVTKFVALAETFTKFNIPYLNKKGSQGLYYPDFIAEQEFKKGKTINWIIETKGFEDENVKYKDAEAENWCKIASKITEKEWRFLKVPDSFFKGLKKTPDSFLRLVNQLEVYLAKRDEESFLP